MVSRPIGGQNTVTQVVAPQDSAVASPGILDQAADIGQKIIKAGQEAKITENFSKAQLELGQLHQQYEIDAESDPFGGMKKFQEARKQVLDQYGSDISPFFRRQWDNNARQLSKTSDAQVNAWAFKQTRVNTVNSINSSIKTNLSQAALDGENFGNSDATEIGSMLNYARTKQKLADFGDTHIGHETTTRVLENYDSDYLKTFVSGVADSNPLKALRLMDSDEVKSGFKDGAQYLAMRKAIETRSLAAEKIGGQKQVLSILKDENNVLTQSLEKPMSYADLQTTLDKTGASPSARAYFMKMNGFGEGAPKLNDAQKLQASTELYTQIIDLSKKPDASAEDIHAMQGKVYEAMTNDAISQDTGVKYMNNIIQPFVAQKEKSLQGYSDNHFLAPDVGFKGIQKDFEDNYALEPVSPTAGKTTLNETQQKAQDKLDAINGANRLKLYDYYNEALDAGAKSYGIKMGDIPTLGKIQQKQIYGAAQTEAKRLYLNDQHPALSTLHDTPNQIYSDGVLIQGMAGDRNIKPNASAPASFKLQAGSDGNIYRAYPDGRFELVGKDPRR